MSIEQIAITRYAVPAAGVCVTLDSPDLAYRWNKLLRSNIYSLEVTCH